MRKKGRCKPVNIAEWPDTYNITAETMCLVDAGAADFVGRSGKVK